MGERGDRSILPLSGSRQAAKTTIVGGQPPGNARAPALVPAGLEQLLGMAAVDASFATILLNDRDEALERSGLELTPSEEATLRAVDGVALEQMLGRLGSTLAAKDRRAFLALAAAALAGLGTMGLACKSAPTEKPIPNAGQPVRLPPKPRPPKPVDKPGTGLAQPGMQRGIGGLTANKPPATIGGAMADKPGTGSGTAKPKPKPKPSPPVSRGIRPDRPKRPKK